MERAEHTVMKRPAAKGKKATSGEKPEGEMDAGAEDKPKRKAKAKAKSKAKGSPTKKACPSAASDAGDVSEHKASPKKRARKAPKCDDDAAMKRRARVDVAYAKLKEVMPYLLPTSGLNGRLSFTVKDPKKEGSSVGVILASSSFYVAKAVQPKHWPEDCAHLQVDICHVGFGKTFFAMFSFTMCCGITLSCDRWIESKGLLFLGDFTLMWHSAMPKRWQDGSALASNPNPVNHIWFNLKFMANPC